MKSQCLPLAQLSLCVFVLNLGPGGGFSPLSTQQYFMTQCLYYSNEDFFDGLVRIHPHLSCHAPHRSIHYNI